MIITYIRSSSFNEHTLCPHSFFLTYNIGEKKLSNKAADKGTVVHKALETLARVKKARQDGIDWYDDEAFGRVNIDSVTSEQATRWAFDYYTGMSTHHVWTSYDLNECIRWTNKAININKGMFDPRNHNIIEAEQKFDFTIEKSWAHYKYILNGETIEGQLSLKGTMDLIVEDEPGLIEIIDYKTGKRKDWAKESDEKKTYQELRYDPQLCLYHYATSHLFPKAEEIFVTIIFINDGGAYTLCFDKSDLDYTEEILKAKFDEIRETAIPPLNVGWKCTKFCYFGMHKSKHDPSKTICEFYRDKVRRQGIEKTMAAYGKKNVFNEYGSAGGRVVKDE